MQSTSGLGKRKLETSENFQPPKRIKTSDTLLSLASNLTREFIESYCSKETSLEESRSLISRINNALLYETENECRLQASIWDETQSKLTNTRIKFSGKTQITNVSCDCLFNKQNWCVHIVATLLLLHENPSKIQKFDELKEKISKLSREQLEQLILSNLEDGAFLSKLQYIINNGMIDQTNSLDETIDTKLFVTKIDDALKTYEYAMDDYCDCEEYEEYGECDCYYRMELDVEKIIEELLNGVEQMWKKKNFANALKVLSDITQTVLNKKSSHAKERSIRLIDKEWRKICLHEDFPEKLRQNYKTLLKEWNEKLKSELKRFDAFSSAAELLEIGWDHLDLKKILSGDDYEKTKLKEKLSTVIERLQYLHLHGRTKEGYYLANYITRREIESNDEMSLWNLANAVKLDYPVGAIIILSKIMWLKIRGIGILTTSNIVGQDQIVTTMFELVCQNKKREITDQCPPLQKLASIALANALEKFYENNWDNCTELLLRLPEGIVQSLGVHLAAMLYRKLCESGHYYDTKHYKKLIELGEQEAAFEIGLSGLRQIIYGEYYYSSSLEENRAVSLLNLACKLGKSYVYRLIDKVKLNANSSSGDTLFDFAKELKQKGSYNEELVDLLMIMIPLRWRVPNNKRDAINMLINLTMNMGVKKLQEALEVIFHNIQDFVILLDILRQLKTNHKKLAKTFSFICCAKVKDEAPKFLKLPPTCTCDVCMRRSKEDRGFSNPTRDAQEKAAYIDLPELMIELHLKDGKLSPSALKKLKEAMNTTQLIASFAMALKDIDPKESMELALKAASSEGKINRKELADTFCALAKEQGNLEYAQKLAMSVAQLEPSAESFERLKSLVPLSTYEKLKKQLLPKQFSNLSPKLVEILLNDNQLVSLQNIINGTKVKKLLACMDIVNKCTEKGIPAEECEANFWEHVTKSAREHWTECALSSFTIPFPRTTIDEWLFTLLNSPKGYNTLALQLYKLRTEIFAEKISSTRPKSYEAFVEWLRQVKTAFEKCGVENEWSEYLEKITQINTVKCKPKLMSLIRKDIVINSKEEVKTISK